ncbi:MAG: ATP-binding cassette domain-containing protein [Burkholderiales bacterium]|jgi:phospholipid/cholesterol/gamma-HCH transport system ATP-binding protein|nr:ATP-binding cassette domain-containing protein [Burkholderiales bacterium]
MSAAIQVEKLWTQFGDSVVHRDLDLTVHAGEVLALVGGSGSGKSTLLREILGLQRPTRGTVKVFGISLHDASEVEFRKLRKRMGVLFQGGALYSALPVFDNVALPLRELRCFDEDFIRDVVMLKLAMVDIQLAHAHKMPAELSGGMVKRVALARALALDPELLFLDEPTAGLDPDRSESFVKLIEELRHELRLTVVMVTHDLDTIVSSADRVAVLADQRVLVAGPIEEVTRTKHPFIESYFLGDRGLRALAAFHQHPLPPALDDDDEEADEAN